MVLADVNVLVQAFRRDAPEHERCRRWLDSILEGDSPFGVSPQVLSGVVRILTHPKVFRVPDPVEAALDFCQSLLRQEHSIVIQPGDRHWAIFESLCRETAAKGNLVPDAWLAALAIEQGCRWVTLDRDFARFPDLHWTAP